MLGSGDQGGDEKSWRLLCPQTFLKHPQALASVRECRAQAGPIWIPGVTILETVVDFGPLCLRRLSQGSAAQERTNWEMESGACEMEGEAERGVE